MAYAASALENNSAERLFRVLDERSRHALYSIHADRSAALALIESNYPEEQRPDARSALGVVGESPADLFAQRCDESCRQWFSQRVGAPMEERREGEERVVSTPRGELRLYRAEEDHWWGIVWQREELDRERDRAGQDLRQVEANAETYRRRRTLQQTSD